MQTLTPRQLSVLEMYVEGMTIREIAMELGVHGNTVKNALAGCKKRMGLSQHASRHELTLRAWQWGVRGTEQAEPIVAENPIVGAL